MEELGEGGLDFKPLSISNKFTGKEKKGEQTLGEAVEAKQADFKVNILKVYCALTDYS